MRRKKTVCILIAVFLLLAAGALVLNLTRYPLKCDIFDLAGMEREEIAKVYIFRYGKSLYVTDPEDVSRILDSFQTESRRGRNHYFWHSSGFEYLVCFIDHDGNQSPTFSISGKNGEQIFNYRYYSYHTAADFSIVEALWEAEFK